MLPDTANPNTILVIRLSAIGDIVMASGLLNSLKSRWPDANIVWLAEPVGATMLHGHPLLKEVLELPRARWKRLRKQGRLLALFKEIKAFRRQLKAQSFDLIIDVQGLLKSGIWAWQARGTLKIGLGSKEGSHWFFHQTLPRENTPIIASEYRALAKQLGCSMSQYQMSIARSEQTRQAVDTLLSDRGVSEYAVFCVYTTRPQKHWFEGHWMDLAEKVRKKYRIPVLIVGGPEDAEHAKDLAACGNMLSVAGQTTLPETAELVRRARFVVGVDTGVTHMGIMHNVPTVCLFGSTAPYLSAEGAEIIYLNKSCSPCKRKPSCDGEFHCMADISAKSVLKRLKMLRVKANNNGKSAT